MVGSTGLIHEESGVVNKDIAVSVDAQAAALVSDVLQFVPDVAGVSRRSQRSSRDINPALLVMFPDPSASASTLVCPVMLLLTLYSAPLVQRANH